MSKERTIQSSAGSKQIIDLLQSIFVSELIYPSECLWIVSPWISDIPIIDNKANQFIYLNPDWAKKLVRFSEVITNLIQFGAKIHIATRPESHNELFVQRLKTQIEAIEKEDQLRVHFQENLHEKGILGDSFYLSGSMNFTFNGITLNEEKVIFSINKEKINEEKFLFSHRWGD